MVCPGGLRLRQSYLVVFTRSTGLFFLRVPYYFGDLNRDPHLENYPYRTLLVPIRNPIETLIDPFKEPLNPTHEFMNAQPCPEPLRGI